ncbi:MAG: hypothetical protein WBK55_08105 [Alphaproteobacteria bacterium]
MRGRPGQRRHIITPAAQLQNIENRIAVMTTEARALRFMKMNHEADQIDAVRQSLEIHRHDWFEKHGPYFERHDIFKPKGSHDRN